ncbi:MAG: aldo/keto reductase, partial [Alphaproteobacteria bacterium]
GVSEEIVGRALEGRRDKVILATKCGLVWHRRDGHHFFDYDGTPTHLYLGRDSIVFEVEQSLKRLRTDRIDHYVTHWQDATTPIEETMEALEQLKTAGKIRSIGVSNTTPDDVRAYLAAGQLDAIQEEYSMIKRDIEQSLLPICAEHGVAAISYSSLSLGLLTGRLGPERTFEGDDQRKDNPLFSVPNRLKVAAFAKDIADIAGAHSATTTQIVIAWTLRQPGITFALCGARNPAQAIENAHAGRIRLTSDDLKEIDLAAQSHLSDLDR